MISPDAIPQMKPSLNNTFTFNILLLYLVQCVRGVVNLFSRGPTKHCSQLFSFLVTTFLVQLLSHYFPFTTGKRPPPLGARHTSAKACSRNLLFLWSPFMRIFDHSCISHPSNSRRDDIHLYYHAD